MLQRMARDGLDAGEAAFLDQLGLRLRRARAAVGLARRELAQRSGVSERYLAQLEGGQGNVSILLLRRVSAALGLDLQELVVPPVDVERRGRVALVGLDEPLRRACAEALGGRLGLPVFHLDLAASDPAAPPDAEAEVASLASLVDAHARCLLAVGEGLLAEPSAARILRARCFTVWLRLPEGVEMPDPQAGGAGTAAAAVEGGSAAAESPASPPELIELRLLRALRTRLLARADRVVECAGSDASAWVEALAASLADSPVAVALNGAPPDPGTG